MRYIDSSSSQKTLKRRRKTSELSDALKPVKAYPLRAVPVGKFLLINNLFWLHGRDRFTPHLTCVAGFDAPARIYFAYAASHYQTHQ